MSAGELSQLIRDGGAVAVFIVVFAAAITGYLRFRPGVDGQVAAKDQVIDELRTDRDYWRDHATKLADAVDKLGDAVDRGNERMRAK